MIDFTPTRKPRRFQMRGIVRDYIFDHFKDNPDATVESATPAVKDRLKEDFGASPWLPILLLLVETLLPLLLELLTKRD